MTFGNGLGGRKQRGQVHISRFLSFSAPSARTATGTQRRLQAQLLDGGPYPRLAPVGPPAGHTSPERHDFRLMLRLVDELGPASGLGKRPGAEQSLQFQASLSPSPQASPPPGLGLLHQAGPQRVAFGIPHDLIKVIVRFDRKRFVPTLVQMPFANFSSMLLPASDVGDREPLHERGKLVVLLRPQNQVPMIGHQAKAADPHGKQAAGFGQDFLERLEVGGLVEEAPPPHASIENVVHVTPRRDSRSSGHCQQPRNRLTPSQYMDLSRTCPLCSGPLFGVTAAAWFLRPGRAFLNGLLGEKNLANSCRQDLIVPTCCGQL